MTRQLRILHVIPGLTTGGAEAVLYRLASSSSPAVKHEVVCLEDRAWFSDKLEGLGIKVHHLSWSSVGLPTAIVRLHRIIRSADADLVQTWMYRSNLFGGVSSWMVGKPVVWNIRCSTFHVYPLATRLLAYAGGFVARWVPRHVINCSTSSRRLHARLGYDSPGGTVIPNGYDAEAFYPDDSARAAMRTSLGSDANSFVIATIGRWHRQKGIPDLLSALRLLLERGIPVKLQMIGRGLDAGNRELNALIDSNGCRDAVLLIGERTDIPDVARAPDLHVVSSIGGEGFPNAIAETMLSGTPNVTTDVGDARDIVHDTGWIVAPGDAHALADAVEEAYREWAESPDRWARRRSAARERIESRFTLDRMVQAYEEVWRNAATKHKRARALIQPSVAGAAANPARKPLRVLHIINSLTLGGAEALLYRLVTRDSANEHVVVSLGREGWYSSRLTEHGVPLHHLDMDSLPGASGGLLRLQKIIRESDADVVQCWMYRSNVVGGAVAKAAGKPVVWGIHCSSLEPLRPSSRAMVHVGGFLARSIPDFIVNCSTRSDEIHAKLGYSAAEGAVVHNGYDSSTFFPNEDGRKGARKGLGLAPDVFAIASIARWHPQKDLPNLLAAVRLVKDRIIEFRCFLVGADLGPDNRNLTAAIERTGCSGLVVPLGPRSDIPSIARALDLHVLASCGGEAFPNVVAETMLSETPNVVTDVGDSALMVAATGWVVPPQSPQQLADAIVEAYREWKDAPGKWQERRKAARRQIADNFSIERMAEAYEEVWRKVAGVKRVSEPAP